MNAGLAGSVPGLSQNSLRPTVERPCSPCRFSGARQIHGAQLSLSPEINIDFVDRGTAWYLV
jgi:hypothetical protein